MFYNLLKEFKKEIKLKNGYYHLNDNLKIKLSDNSFFITDLKNYDITIASYNKDYDQSIYKTIVLFVYDILFNGYINAAKKLNKKSVNNLDCMILVLND